MSDGEGNFADAAAGMMGMAITGVVAVKTMDILSDTMRSRRPAPRRAPARRCSKCGKRRR